MSDIIIEVPTELTYVIDVPRGEQGPQGATGATGATGPAFTPTEVSYTVSGGTSGTQPTFTGSPMFYGSYMLVGDLVNWRINVEFDNITSFGTGQYYVSLPFDAKYGTMFRGGCLHRASNGDQYSIGGHVLPGESQLTLWYIGSNGHDELFDHNSPYTLTTADSFHISGTYIRTAD